MAKKDYSTANPITSRDWFLRDLFNDPRFVEIRNQFRAEIAEFDPGISQLVEYATDERTEQLLSTYAAKVSDLLNIAEDIARKGLFHHDHLNTWSRNRGASARIDGNHITIAVGAETRIDDVRNIWSSVISPLQDELSATRSKRLIPSNNPSLAYVIHKHLLEGRKLSDIHRDYQHSKLDGYSGKYGDEEYSEFRRQYENTVIGIKKAF